MNKEKNLNITQPDELSLSSIAYNLKNSVQLLVSKWIIILVFGMIGGITGFVYALIKQPIYSAVSTFVLEESNSKGSLSQYAGLASIAGIDFGAANGLFQSENIMELYRSRRMIKSALLEINPLNKADEQLIDRYLEFKGFRKKWKDDVLLKNITFKDTSRLTILHDSVLNTVIKDVNSKILSVNKSDKGPGIFRVEVKAEDQIFAKRFADQIVNTVNHFYIDTKTKKSRINLYNLEHQADSVKAVMNRTVYSSAATLDATPNLNPTRQRLRVSVENSRINAETNRIILGELVKQLEITKMAMRTEVPLIQLIDAPVLPLEKTDLGKLTATGVGIMLFVLLSCFLLLVGEYFKRDMGK